MIRSPRVVYLQPQWKTKLGADVPESPLMLKLDQERWMQVISVSMSMRVELRKLISAEGWSIYKSFNRGVLTAGWLIL